MRRRRWLKAVGAVCVMAMSAAPAADATPVAKPRFVQNIATGETGWFSSPSLADLNGDRRLEIVAPFYSTFVYSSRGRLLGKGTATRGRVYAPSVVADLDRDGVREVVVGGNEGTVAAYSLSGGRLQLEPGWPASTCSGGQCPETRGLAAGDLDGDGRVEVVATTTNTSRAGSQVFAFDASGASVPGWPRYNQGSDAAFNGAGNHGYGRTGRTSASASSTATGCWRSWSRSTTTRSTSSTTTARQCSRRPGTGTARAPTPAAASGGGSSSAG